MIPFIPFMLLKGKGIAPSPEFTFFHYKKDPKERSLLSFLLYSLLLGVINLVLVDLIIVNVVLSTHEALLFTDKLQENFLLTLLIGFGQGIVINFIGWLIFRLSNK